jgi:hypothetical protein
MTEPSLRREDEVPTILANQISEPWNPGDGRLNSIKCVSLLSSLLTFHIFTPPSQGQIADATAKRTHDILNQLIEIP